MSNTVEFDFNFDKLMDQVEKMGVDVKKIEAPATKDGAEVIKTALEKNVGRGKGKEHYEHDKNKKYIHIADDIKISNLKEDKETLDSVREIHGGKYTGYKWKWLEFGTVKMTPNHFMTKSIQETKKEVKEIIDNNLKKALNL